MSRCHGCWTRTFISARNLRFALKILRLGKAVGRGLAGAAPFTHGSSRSSAACNRRGQPGTQRQLGQEMGANRLSVSPMQFDSATYSQARWPPN